MQQFLPVKVFNQVQAELVRDQHIKISEILLSLLNLFIVIVCVSHETCHEVCLQVWVEEHLKSPCILALIVQPVGSLRENVVEYLLIEGWSRTPITLFSSVDPELFVRIADFNQLGFGRRHRSRVGKSASR